MKKIAAWPPQIGTVENTSFVDPGGDYNKDIVISESQKPHDALVAEKNTREENSDEIMSPSTDYEGGIISPVDGVDYETKLAYNQLKDKANIEVIGSKGIIVSFSCNVAKSFSEKVSGLQAYPTLKESAGLLFPYRRVEDVIYHMGTVLYPIDILFIDSENKIKKMYKNIQPGTLGTFGCASVKYVLEICGGLSDRLGIYKGSSIRITNKEALPDRINKISSEINIEKDVIIKYSNLELTRFSNWKGYPILVINTNSLVKKASNKKLITNLVSEFVNNKNDKIYAFDFDGLIEESPVIRVYKTSELRNDDDIPYIKIDGHTVGINKTSNGIEEYRDVSLYKLAEENLDSNEAIILSLNKSFSSFIRTPEVTKDAIDIFKEVKRVSKESNAKIIFLTRFANPNYIRDIICNRINLEFGDRCGLKNIEAMNIAKDSDASDIIKVLRDKFGNKDIRICSNESLLKRAGIPVSDDVKIKAKRAYKYLDMTEKTVEESFENMESNLYEYGKVKDKPDVILNSKGQYNQSVKAQTKIVKDYLVKAREAIRIFNDIKDISTTFEIINSLAMSAKSASEGAEEIFDLIEKLDNPDFYLILSEKTEQYGRLVDDFKSVIDRAKNYINTEILGLVILSS